MTLTVDELRGHIETVLSDEALGLLLDAAYEAIDAILGSGGDEDYAATVTEILSPGGDLLMLSRRASAITAVTEGVRTPTDLATDDYQLIGDQLVRRLSDGTNGASRWRDRVQITYTAFADENERDRAAIALVKLDSDYQPGVQSERLGDHSISFGFSQGSSTYTEERDAILASLGGGFIAK